MTIASTLHPSEGLGVLSPAAPGVDGASLSLDDLVSLLQHLERAAVRGGFELSEFEEVGRLHRVLRSFLSSHRRELASPA